MELYLWVLIMCLLLLTTSQLSEPNMFSFGPVMKMDGLKIHLRMDILKRNWRMDTLKRIEHRD